MSSVGTGAGGDGALTIARADSSARTLAERVAEVLRGSILSGELKPGRRLPIEELATHLGTSPMPVREALRQLAAVGLVENIPHRGARVTELSLGDLEEVYEARLALEPLAVRHAAEKFTPEDERRAQVRLAELDEATAAKDDDAIWTAHSGFHFALYEVAGSRWLDRLIAPLWESSERYRRAAPGPRKVRERGAEHRRILAACVAGDADRAERELHDHLARTANLVATEMGGRPLFELRG